MAVKWTGSLSLVPPLNNDQVAYLRALNGTRRVTRDWVETVGAEDPKRRAVGLPIGEDGMFYVGGSLEGIVDNEIPPGQPRAGSIVSDGALPLDDREKQLLYEHNPGHKVLVALGFDHIGARCEQEGRHGPQGEHGCRKGWWHLGSVDPSIAQPSLYCPWTAIGPSHLAIVEDQAFADKWLEWIIEWLFSFWGITVSGTVHYDDGDDYYGHISVENNIVTVHQEGGDW